MADSIDEMAGPEIEKIKIILNTLYLCIEYVGRHVAQHEGTRAASALKTDMLTALKNGDVDMALLEDKNAFDLVISKIDQLIWDAPRDAVDARAPASSRSRVAEDSSPNLSSDSPGASKEWRYASKPFSR